MNAQDQFAVEGAQPLPVIDVERFFRMLRKDPSLLEKLHPDDQATLRRAGLRSEPMRTLPLGVRSAREAVWHYQQRKEPVPEQLASYAPLDPEWAKTEENAVRNWRPRHSEAFRELLRAQEEKLKLENAGRTSGTRSETVVEHQREPEHLGSARVDETSGERAPDPAPSGPTTEPQHGKTPPGPDSRTDETQPESARYVQGSLETPAEEPQHAKPGEPEGSAAESARTLRMDEQLRDEPTIVERAPPVMKAVITGDNDNNVRVLSGEELKNGKRLNPPDILKLVGGAAARVSACADESRANAAHGAERHRRAGKPTLPPERPRREVLRASLMKPCDRANTPQAYREKLGAMDRQIRVMTEQITSDPVWSAAEYVERTVRVRSTLEFPPSRDDLQRNRDLREAMLGLQDAQESFDYLRSHAAKARKSLEAYQQRSRSWARGLQNFVFDTERKLQAGAEEASRDLVRARGKLRDAEGDAKALYAEHLSTGNDEALAELDLARKERTLIERPLRDAVLERQRAELTIKDGRAPERAMNAPANTPLRHIVNVSVHGFGFAELEGPGGKSYFLDHAEHPELIPQLKPGTQITLSRDEHGSRHFQLLESPAREPESRERERARSR
jgi:hypothetical protein